MAYLKIPFCTTPTEQTPLAIPNNFVILADDAFPLKKYLTKPYSRRKLSPVEKNLQIIVAENDLAILVTKFRLFKITNFIKFRNVGQSCPCTLCNSQLVEHTNKPPVCDWKSNCDYEDENYRVVPGLRRQNNSGLQNLPATNPQTP